MGMCFAIHDLILIIELKVVQHSGDGRAVLTPAKQRAFKALQAASAGDDGIRAPGQQRQIPVGQLVGAQAVILRLYQAVQRGIGHAMHDGIRQRVDRIERGIDRDWPILVLYQLSASGKNRSEHQK